MQYDFIFSVIKTARENNSLYWKDHILQRMRQRKISVSEILAVLNDFNIIEEYKEDKPFPSYLLVGFADKKPIHIVVGVNEIDFEIHLITAYIPDDLIWEDNYRRRKCRNVLSAVMKQSIMVSQIRC